MALNEVCPPLGVLEMIKGEALDVSKVVLEGGNVVIEMFATWCGPCVQLAPHLSALQDKFGDIPFVSVSYQPTTRDTVSKIQDFLRGLSSPISYRVALDSSGALGQLSSKYGVRGIPHAFVISDGKVIFSGHPAKPEFESALEEARRKTQKRSALKEIQAISEEELKGLSIGKLKAMLKSMSISAEGCIEKSDLVKRIIEYRDKI